VTTSPTSALRVQPMFPVPFAFDRHPAPEPLNVALRALFLAREGQPYRNRDPYTERNDALFESRFDLFQWPEPEIAELRELCLSRTLQVVQRLNGYPPERMRALRIKVESWFHITRRHGFFGVHNHPNASWSGVYCVDDGRPDPGAEDSGKLTFLHPYTSSVMYADLGNAAFQPPFNVQHVGYVLQPGELVLFPSGLLHHVTPFNGDGERITVAFNCAFPP
jgi:uncharacterized protein (TIGR02466 family)